MVIMVFITNVNWIADCNECYRLSDLLGDI